MAQSGASDGMDERLEAMLRDTVVKCLNNEQPAGLHSSCPE